MTITTRHKTSGGILLGYTVLSDGKKFYVDKDKAITLSEFITNATLTQNNEYRALKGEHIETVIRYNEELDKLKNTVDDTKCHEHKYIDTTKLRDYSKKKTVGDVIRDIRDKYKITNICDDYDQEPLYYISKALYDDYTVQRANYEAYIEVGMNARILMELRKSAVIPMADELFDFYDKHRACETCDDIKKLRANYFKFIHEDYDDLNWQYDLLVSKFLGYKYIDFYFDYEECFADGDPSKQTGPEDYTRDFIDAHVPNRVDEY